MIEGAELTMAKTAEAETSEREIGDDGHRGSRESSLRPGSVISITPSTTTGLFKQAALAKGVSEELFDRVATPSRSPHSGRSADMQSIQPANSDMSPGPVRPPRWRGSRTQENQTKNTYATPRRAAPSRRRRR